jgi:serine/threonine-protein kinase
MNIQTGMQVGDYEILRELGAGGMGKVFQVRNVISDRVEAMKVLLPDLAGDQVLADRFLREIKVLAALEHPNIAGLRTAIRYENQLLMVMEFVEGHTVEDYLEQGPMPPADAVAIAISVLEALDCAHRRGIVHRDIKPSNIMLSHNRQVKLMDFGIARGMTDASLTRTHQTTGSLYYMSPEQINGTQLDGRSDLYSLAVTLYQMLTSRRPFDGESTFAIMAAHMTQPPVPPVQQDPRIPAAVSDVIVTALAKDPNARYQSAEDFAHALSQALRAPAPMAPAPQPNRTPTMQELATPVPTAAPATQPPRKGSGMGLVFMTGGAVAALVLLGVLAFQVPKLLKPKEKEPAADPQPVAAKTTPTTTTPAVTPQNPAVPTDASKTAAQVTPPSNGAQIETKTFNPGIAPGTSAASRNVPVQPVAGGGQPAIDPRGARGFQQPPNTPAYDATLNAQAPTQRAVPQGDTAALNELRQRTIQMAQRIATAKAALQSLQQSMAAQGLRPRAELTGASQRMHFEMDQADAALDRGRASDAKTHLDNAERSLEVLEKALNL